MKIEKVRCEVMRVGIRIKRFFGPILLGWSLFAINANALEIDTHYFLNGVVVDQNKESINSYLNANLDFSKGAEEVVNGQEIISLIQDGGRFEDNGIRWFHHFHTPLEPWDQSGFKDLYLSSILWAQKPVGTQSFFGNWSWLDARYDFYKALTATTDSDRQRYFANTFRAVGQLMHLVQDLSVPAHTRDDAHVLYSYEKWVKAQPVNSLLIQPSIGSDPSILDLPANPLAPIPIAKFFDTDQYDGTNPDITVGPGIGMAEYTNANFFSEDTILNGDFPYPAWSSVVEYEITDNATGETRTYLRKTGDGETVDHLATARWFYKYLPVEYKHLGLKLDEMVYTDYASFLIPRAVGYSAGLLNYFFRGQLHVALLVPSVDQATLDFGNENDTGRNIDRVAVLLQNKTLLNGQIEPMGPGTLTLTVCYTVGLENCQSVEPVLVPSIPDVASDTFASVLFTLPAPIPTQTAQGLTYYLAFQGQLGAEEGAVIGKVLHGPVLNNVQPNEGLIDTTVVTLTGNALSSSEVRFEHDLNRPYLVEVISQSDTAITVKVPQTTCLVKPGYGGVRMRTTLATGEKVYSNSVPFFPIVPTVITNLAGFFENPLPLDQVTVEAVFPILGDYAFLPAPLMVDTDQTRVTVSLKAGFIYVAKGTSAFGFPGQGIEAISCPDMAIFVRQLPTDP